MAAENIFNAILVVLLVIFGGLLLVSYSVSNVHKKYELKSQEYDLEFIESSVSSILSVTDKYTGVELGNLLGISIWYNKDIIKIKNNYTSPKNELKKYMDAIYGPANYYVTTDPIVKGIYIDLLLDGSSSFNSEREILKNNLESVKNSILHQINKTGNEKVYINIYDFSTESTCPFFNISDIDISCTNIGPSSSFLYDVIPWYEKPSFGFDNYSIFYREAEKNKWCDHTNDTLFYTTDWAAQTAFALTKFENNTELQKKVNFYFVFPVNDELSTTSKNNEYFKRNCNIMEEFYTQNCLSGCNEDGEGDAVERSWKSVTQVKNFIENFSLINSIKIIPIRSIQCDFYYNPNFDYVYPSIDQELSPVLNDNITLCEMTQQCGGCKRILTDSNCSSQQYENKQAECQMCFHPLCWNVIKEHMTILANITNNNVTDLNNASEIAESIKNDIQNTITEFNFTLGVKDSERERYVTIKYVPLPDGNLHPIIFWIYKDRLPTKAEYTFRRDCNEYKDVCVENKNITREICGFVTQAVLLPGHTNSSNLNATYNGSFYGFDFDENNIYISMDNSMCADGKKSCTGSNISPFGSKIISIPKSFSEQFTSNYYIVYNNQTVLFRESNSDTNYSAQNTLVAVKYPYLITSGGSGQYFFNLSSTGEATYLGTLNNIFFDSYPNMSEHFIFGDLLYSTNTSYGRILANITRIITQPTIEENITVSTRGIPDGGNIITIPTGTKIFTNTSQAYLLKNVGFKSFVEKNDYLYFINTSYFVIARIGTNNITKISSKAAFGAQKIIGVQDEIAYLLSSNNKLILYNISNKTNPINFLNVTLNITVPNNIGSAMIIYNNLLFVIGERATQPIGNLSKNAQDGFYIFNLTTYLLSNKDTPKRYFYVFNLSNLSATLNYISRSKIYAEAISHSDMPANRTSVMNFDFAPIYGMKVDENGKIYISYPDKFIIGEYKCKLAYGFSTMNECLAKDTNQTILCDEMCPCIMEE